MHRKGEQGKQDMQRKGKQDMQRNVNRFSVV
jgi:hypothetical protein